MRRFLHLLAIGGTFCLGCLLLMLGGCDEARAHAQATADTRAAVQAAQQTPDAAARLRLYDAIGRNIVALTDDLPLPPPTQTPAEIVADPSAFIAAAEKPVAKPELPKVDQTKTATIDPVSWVLTHAGTLFMWAGLGVLGLLGLVLAACLIPWFGIGAALMAILKPWSEYLIETAIGAVAAIAVGYALRWLGSHAWIVYATGGAIALVYLIRHRSLWLPLWGRCVGVCHRVAKTTPRPRAPLQSPSMAPAITPSPRRP